jgi:hypothetical protein
MAKSERLDCKAAAVVEASGGRRRRQSAPGFMQATIDWRSRMKGHFEVPASRDALLEALAGELTLAAYRVALRARTAGTWLDLELDLWRTLVDTVKVWDEGTLEVPVTGGAACAVQRE